MHKVDEFQDKLQQSSNVTDYNEVTLLFDLTQYGSKIVQGRLECHWESDANQTAVRERVGLLFEGAHVVVSRHVVLAVEVV